MREKALYLIEIYKGVIGIVAETEGEKEAEEMYDRLSAKIWAFNDLDLITVHEVSAALEELAEVKNESLRRIGV